MQKRILGLIGIIVLWSNLAEAAIAFLPRYTGDISSRFNNADINISNKLSCSQKGMYDKPTDPCQVCQGEVGNCCASISCSTTSECYQYSEADASQYTCSDSCTDGNGTHYKTCKYRLTCADVNALTTEEASPYIGAGFYCSQTQTTCTILNGTTLGPCTQTPISIGGELVGGVTTGGSLGGLTSGGSSSQQSVTCYTCMCPEGTYSTLQEGQECRVSHQVGGMKCYTCEEKELCPAGTYGENCAKCPVGSYSSTEGAESCKGCPAGYSSKTGITGATSQEAACEICPQGTYKTNIGAGSCTACPTGYTPISGVTGASSVAQACTRSCVPCSSTSYPLSSCPAHAVCESCTPQYCDDSTKSYKITSCEEGYAPSGNACVDEAIQFVVDTSLNKLLSFMIHFTTLNKNVDIDWGDGVRESYQGISQIVSHTYVDKGNYTVTITGNLSGMSDISTTNVVALKQLNLSTVKTFFHTFYGQKNLTGTIPVLPDSLTDGTRMFSGCSGLTGNIPELPTGLTDGTHMFNGCSGLTGTIPELPTGLTDGTHMFDGCSGLTGTIPELPTGLVRGSFMFSGCSGLTGNIPELPTGLADGSGMFHGCSGLTGNIPELPTGLTDGCFMFSGCS